MKVEMSTSKSFFHNNGRYKSDNTFWIVWGGGNRKKTNFVFLAILPLSITLKPTLLSPTTPCFFRVPRRKFLPACNHRREAWQRCKLSWIILWAPRNRYNPRVAPQVPGRSPNASPIHLQMSPNTGWGGLNQVVAKWRN